MGMLRGGFWLSMPMLLVCLPACRPATTIPVHVPQPHLFQPHSTPVNKSSEFAILPERPGQLISLHPQQDVPTEKVTSPTHTVVIEPCSPDVMLPEPVAAKDSQSPLELALRDYLKDQPDSAIKHLNGFDQQNQDLLMQLLPALVRVSQVNLNQPDADETATLARQFETAAAMLAKRAKLTVRKSILCNAVAGFGKYTPVEDAQVLPPGSPYLLYVEVANVPSTPTKGVDGIEWFQTKLDCSMQVKDELGRPIELVDVNAKGEAPKNIIHSTKNEATRSPIHDYFIRAQFDTPTRPGNYSVSFEVRDPRSGQSISKSVGFRVP